MLRRRPVATALLALLLLITQQLALLHVHPAAGGHGPGTAGAIAAMAAGAAADSGGDADAVADLLCAPCLALSQLATLLPAADWPQLPGDAAQAAPTRAPVARHGGQPDAPYQARAPPRLSVLS